MRVASWVGVAAALLVTASCAPYTYNSDTPRGGRYDTATNFNGTWRLVPSRSDYAGDWLDERSRFDADDWQTTDRVSTRYDAWFLPDQFRVSGGRDMLRIEDDGGGLIAEVPLNGDYRYGSYPDREGTYDNRSGTYNDRSGRASNAYWINERQFEVQRVGRNRRLTQTFTLQNRSRRMEVVTRIERDGGVRSFTRMYGRV